LSKNPIIHFNRLSNLDAVAQCPFIMSSTAEQHSYIFFNTYT